MPTAELETRVREWLGNGIERFAEEYDTEFLMRRHATWLDMTGSPAWGDFAGLVVKARDAIIRDLIAGTPNRYKERGDDEKRAMITAMNLILDLPLKVEGDARTAAEAMRQHRLHQVR